MTTTHPSLSPEGPYAAYDLPTALIASNGKFRDLTSRLADRAAAYGMEVSMKKSKILTDSTNNICADIRMNIQKLEEVTISSTWKQPSARMAPAQQRSASGLPQQ